MAAKLQRTVALVLAALLLGACGHGADSSTSNTSTAADASQWVPPANADDVNAWRAFIGKAILAETKDPNMHPYSFIVPAGDTADAVERRKGEAQAIHDMLGRTAMPGNMLALTGPDSEKVAEVINEAFKGAPAQVARGLTVLYVGVPLAAAKSEDVVRQAGAELRVVAMKAP